MSEIDRKTLIAMSLSAEQSMINSQIAGMVAENDYRKQLGHSVAYCEPCFQPLTDRLSAISQEFIGLIHE